VQAIEEQSLDMLDNSDFQDTDVPFEVPLPETPNVSVCGFQLGTFFFTFHTAAKVTVDVMCHQRAAVIVDDQAE